MFNTRNLIRNTGYHKASHRPQRLQSIDAAIRIRGTHH